ncbi:alpha/beta hydrolase [Peptostreptococcaceae bacterium OttesenSCG-928-C18]|nr:alpha/beta hydrolase [Peptostreptococcaceae bacterium OttesenSCG-928-C18]
MIIHKFGDINSPVMMLIHGVLSPWQIWEEQIKYFQEKYFVLVVALNAHTEEKYSDFVSLEQEVAEIENYCKENSIDIIDVVCGVSLGGKIAYKMWKK